MTLFSCSQRSWLKALLSASSAGCASMSQQLKFIRAKYWEVLYIRRLLLLSIGVLGLVPSLRKTKKGDLPLFCLFPSLYHSLF